MEKNKPTRQPYTKEELLKHIEEDEALQDEIFEKYGSVDVVELIRQVREGDD